MNDAMEQRVEQFVQEMLGLLQHARGVSSAAALRVFSTMLAGMGQPLDAKASTERRPPAPRAARTPPKKAATSPRRGQARRGAPSIATEAVEPPAVGPSSPASVSVETKAPPASPATPSSASPAPLPEREALVLDAVRVLGQATAGEVAARSGQPNGSVAVALRSLVARGLVAKSRAARGTEYGLTSAGR
jgi:uncharacterized membrane protein